MKHNPAKRASPPADGERRAMIGYVPQYELAAWVILRHLREWTLDFVRPADPQAERVDDFVIGSSEAVSGYSLKWSQYRSSLSFNDLVKPRKNAPCWIAQLAEGHRALRAAYPNRRVTVHLVTSNIASSSDSCPGASGTNKTFAAFLHQAWLPHHESGQPIPTGWLATWEALRLASGLDAEAFGSFVKNCKLELNAMLPTDRSPSSRDEKLFLTQLRQLAGALAYIVRDPSRKVEYSRDELLKRVGWGHLFKFRHRHEFPVTDPYEPIDQTINELKAKLEALPGGYIALLGSPGSGKSTLLTRTLEAGLNNHRLVKYYAYVPDSIDPMASRGESVNFLHDLVVSLERAGFVEGQSQGEFDRHLLLERLHKQLQALGEDYVKTKFPTLILIDGLDHIPREQQPERSLVADIPIPDQVPAGVFFVLGSQTDDLPGLPPAVLKSIQKPSRRVNIQPLTREAVFKVIVASKLPVALSQQQQDKAISLAAGHPLALSLLLNRLKAQKTPAEVDAVLSEAVAFTGSVDDYYFSHWRMIEAQPGLADFVGLLARLRRSIDLEWVASWTPHPPVGELRRRLAHFFREERPDHWRFFHNSFRQYVLTQSANAYGAGRDAADRYFHNELAAKCANAPIPHAWEEVFHVAKTGDLKRVTELATSEYFSHQLEQFRPIDRIRHDARYAALAAGRQHDILALVRMTLFLAELEQREYAIDGGKIGQLLLDIGEDSLAIEYLWDGPELRVDEVTALRVARLIHAGYEPLARRLFESAEPLTLFQRHGDDDVDFNRDARDVLREWARIAPVFRPVKEVVELIRGITPPKSRFHNTNEDATIDDWRRDLLFCASLSMHRLGRVEEAVVLERALRAQEDDQLDYSIWLQIHIWRSLEDEGDIDRARVVFDDVLQSFGVATLSDEAKLVVAQGALTLRGRRDFAEQVFKTVEVPRLEISSYESGPSFDSCVGFFRYFRLLAYFGENISAIAVVPDPAVADDWPRVLLSRTLIQIAKVWADAWKGKFYTGSDVRQYLHQPLRLFHLATKDTRRWHSWYGVTSLRKDIYSLLIDAVREHGMVAVEALRDEMDSLWSNSETMSMWSAEARRDAVVALYEAGVEVEWAEQLLQAIAETMLQGQDVSGRVEQCEAQANAWLCCGKMDYAIRELKRLVSVSFGVGYRKDSQMDSWVAWLDSVLALDSERAPSRVALFAAAIGSMEESTEGQGTRSASLGLIRSFLPVSPRRAVGLIHWFQNHSSLGHANAVDTVLRVAAERGLCRSAVLEVLFTRFLLVFSTDVHPELARAVLLAMAANLRGSDDLTRACRRMAHAVKVYALNVTRSSTLQAMAETANSLQLSLVDCGLDPRSEEQSTEDRHESTLKLKDGTTVNREQINAQATSVDGFLRLIEQQDESYFRWESVLDPLLARLTLGEVKALVKRLPSTFAESLSFSKISRRLSNLGDRATAWDVAQKALEFSRPYGWSRWSDGGTRLEALGALVAADSTRGRILSMEKMTDDLTSGLASPSVIAQHLTEILPLLHSNPPLLELYTLVAQHVERLSAPLTLLDSARSKLLPTITDDTVERALCDLLSYHLAELVPLLAQAAQTALCDLLRIGSQAAERSVTELLCGSPRQRTAAVAMLEVLGIDTLEAVRPFSDSLRGLAQSPNYWVSITARSLCRRLGMEELPKRPPRTLHASYRLVLPPSSDRPAPAEPDVPLPESKEPRDLVRPFDLQLSLFAKMSGVDEENLFAATAMEMKRLADPTELLPAAEKQFRYFLDRAELKLPYRRNRGAYAREAMQRVVSDLVDAKRISTENMPLTEQIIRFFDPRLARVHPDERPTEVKPITGLEPYGGKTREWVSQVPTTLPDHVRRCSGRVVLAEFTKLKCLDWKTPYEIRQSALAKRERPPSGDARVFGRVHDVIVAEYPTMHIVEEDSDYLILQNNSLASNTDGTDWIALNPLIGVTLGWRDSSSGLFRWMDADDIVMVETLWWKDGCIHLPAPERESEVGEGFLVLASQRALQLVCEFLGTPRRSLFLRRSCRDNGTEEIDGPLVRVTEEVSAQ